MACSLSGTFLKFSSSLFVKRKPCLCMRQVRHRMKWRGGGRSLDLTKTLEEKLNDMKIVDAALDKEVNIGFPLPQDPVSERMKHRQWQLTRGTKEMAARERQLKVVLDDVKEVWLREFGPRHVRSVVDHYGIYRDLFEGAFFYPTVHLNINYDYDDEFVTPVYTGNKISPADTGLAPDVQYESDPETLWTLVMSSPDGNLADSQSECLHWMIGNIPGNSIDQGETICNYLQPFPPKGVGFLRYVFVLYKQGKKIDYSSEKRSLKRVSLKDRAFRTFDFYSGRQDDLTPAGLAFFQSEWDASVHHTFHHTLGMPEPTFEFIHPPPYHPRQMRYPIRQPFNLYLDRYKDVKEIQEEVLKEKLKRISPFAPHPETPKFPGLKPLPRSMPSWLKTKVRNMRFRRHQWKDLPGERL